MLSISRKVNSSGIVVYELSGVIDESSDFSSFADGGPIPSEFGLDLFAIKRINSVGIKKWISFFEALQRKGMKIFIQRASPAIVEQMVNISNFRCGAEVQSVVLPYHCKSCSKPVFFVKTKEDLANIDLEKVNWPCPLCQGTELEFDDLPDEYLRFWRK